MQVPCVTTPIAAAPLLGEDQAPDGIVAVGDNARQLADHILRLLRSPQQREQLAQGGHSFVRQRYGWQATVQPLETLLGQVAAKHQS